MRKTISKLFLTLVLFAHAGQTCALEKDFNSAREKVGPDTKAYLVIDGAIIIIGPGTHFPKGKTQGVVITDTKLDTKRPGGKTALEVAFQFEAGRETRKCLEGLLKCLHAERTKATHRHKLICEFLQEIWEHYVGHGRNTTRREEHYVEIYCKGGEVLGKIVPTKENAYGALFKESGEWYFDYFRQELEDELQLNKCLRSLIMQLELYGTSEPILSSKLYRKSFSELFQELLTNFNSQSQNFNAEFKFISVIQSFNFITLKAREHYEPRSGSSTYIVVFTEIHPRLMKKGGKYKMIYDFVSNETKPDLQAHLALVKANCGQEAYRKEFLERVEQLVSENKKSYFKVDRNGSEVTIVECPTIDAHGSCVTTKMNDDMEVKWFYQKPEEDDFTGPLIAYYNNNEGRTHFKQPNIIESWPEEDSSKRRKLH